MRIFTRHGGELSVDMIGPVLIEGAPPTDRPTKRKDWSKYMLVAAFTPFNKEEAQARHDQETEDRHVFWIGRLGESGNGGISG